MRQTIGHHRLAHMVFKGPPNFIDRKVFTIGKWVKGLETRWKIYVYLWAVNNSVSPFLLNLDYVKDLVLYLILKETVQRQDENCMKLSDLGIDCLAASGT